MSLGIFSSRRYFICTFPLSVTNLPDTKHFNLLYTIDVSPVKNIRNVLLIFCCQVLKNEKCEKGREEGGL